MPLYEYLCEACGQRFEVIQKFSDPPPDACKLCGKGPIERQQASPAIQFKGTGWYITDYARKGQTDASSSTKSSSKSESSTGAEGKSEVKSEAKSETAAKTESTKTEAPAAKKE